MKIQENIRQYVNNLVDNYREKLEKIKYVDTFSNIIIRWEQWNERAPQVLPSTPDDRNRNRVNGGRWHGVKEPDALEEEYFNTSDDEDETIPVKDSPTSKQQRAAAPLLRNNGRLPRPLVEYEDEDEPMEGIGDATTTNNDADTGKSTSNTPSTVPTLRLRHSAYTSSSSPPSPTEATIPTPERLAEKRRRTELEDDDDELGKLSVRINKKRTSSPTTDGKSAGGLQRKRSGTGLSSGVWGVEGVVEPAKKKIAISLNAGKAGTGMGITTSTVSTASTTADKVVKRALKAVEGEEDVDAGGSRMLTGDRLGKLTMGNGENSEVQLASALNPSSGIGTGDDGGRESDGNKE